MEIGTEISKKIRAAIKGKLQELGAYVDEELPDYIMVMVANKKSSQQMSDDLSLFLGNNTIKFTVWLHGVLEKLKSTAVEPASQHAKLLPSDISTAGRGDLKREESRALTMSSSRADRLEGRVSSSAHEHHGRRTSSDHSSSMLTSKVKPLLEHSAEAVIDIKPDLEDDDLIPAEPRAAISGKPRPISSRSSNRGSERAAGSFRSSEVMRGQERSSSVYGRSYREDSSKEEFSRKRKAPVASSVVRIQKSRERVYESDEDEDDEEDYGVQSRVSLPPKPERRPSLPPAKQANKNLILKAISEAQDSISKTTSVYTNTQRQTLPVAPRTRSASNEMNRAAIRLVQEHLHEILPQEVQPTRPHLPSRSLASRLQQDDVPNQEKDQQFELQLLETARLKALDTRSFITRKPELEQNPPIRSRLDQETAPPTTPRTVQAREKPECSPKFIVTLDGVPSPLASLTEHDMEVDHAPNIVTLDPPAEHRTKPVQLSMTSDLLYDDEGMMDRETEEQMEEESVQVKRKKALERCKFWPVCKSGDECVYHHPIIQCRMFPSCVFGEKCLFIHPNCKYNSKCSKPDCPFTHISRRAPMPPPKPAPPAQSSSVCRFFPECKRTDCTFYHPKLCRFAEHCNRAGCTFYHPQTSVPPRHALKWTKAQAS